MRTVLLLILLLGPPVVFGQQVFLKLVSPSKNQISVTASRQFITGTTCKDCRLFLNQSEIKVWPTGAFAAEVNLRTGDTVVQLVAVDAKEFKSTQALYYSYRLPEKEKEVASNTVAYWRVEPQGNLLLQTGDRIQMTLKTRPGSVVKLGNGFELKEVPLQNGEGIRGIYKGEYVVKEKEDLFTEEAQQLQLTIQGTDGQQMEAISNNSYALMPQQPLIVQTKGKLPYLLMGLGEDRLGGTKIGYLDSLVKLAVVGKVGNKYKIQLSRSRQAYIEEQHVKKLNDYSFTPSSLTGSMRVWGDRLFDYVSLSLTERLPYQSFQEVNPEKIIVDVFGATANTNWLTQMQSAQAIKQVSYQQLEEGIFRITIELKQPQHWGHSVSYNGTNLLIRVKRKPASLLLKDLVIGVDAGHGGNNKGAFGITGIMEKEMTLLIAKEVQQVLQAEGATVIMSRTADTVFENHDRYIYFKDKNPDLLLSIHLNSSGDPLRSKGIGMFYKHIGYRSLSEAILQRMTGMGLKEYGLTGSFNFILNGFTEFPNALVETLFISNPEEEANVLTPAYRRQLAEAIVRGVADWLQQVQESALKE